MRDGFLRISFAVDEDQIAAGVRAAATALSELR
jgi:hypothetical protein